MNHAIVRYRVKPDAAAENIDYIRAVFAQLQADSPAGIRYASIVGEDGVTFTHIAIVEDKGSNPLPSLEAFKAFQAGLGERCEVLPQATWGDVIGDFGLFT